jgi:hypothetical protein
MNNTQTLNFEFVKTRLKLSFLVIAIKTALYRVFNEEPMEKAIRIMNRITYLEDRNGFSDTDLHYLDLIKNLKKMAVEHEGFVRTEINKFLTKPKQY